MELNFVVPIENFDFIGKNKNLDEMIVDKEIYGRNIEPFIIDDDYKIAIREFDSYSLPKDFFNSTETFSKMDIERIGYARWGFYFTCRLEDVKLIEIRINLLLLLLRILFYSNASCKYYLYLDTNFHILSYKNSDDWKYALANIETDHIASKSDLDNAKLYYGKLLEFYSLNNRTQHAINFLFLSYTSYYWQELFALLFISLETLFSPPKETNITNTIIKRAVAFIDNPQLCSKNKLSKLYELRSDIVHGRIRMNLDFKEKIKDLVFLQKIVLECYKKIITSDLRNIYTSEENKEDYFNKLIPLNHKFSLKTFLQKIKKYLRQ